MLKSQTYRRKRGKPPATHSKRTRKLGNIPPLPLQVATSLSPKQLAGASLVKLACHQYQPSKQGTQRTLQTYTLWGYITKVNANQTCTVQVKAHNANPPAMLTASLPGYTGVPLQWAVTLNYTQPNQV